MSSPVLAYVFSLVTLCFVVCSLCGIWLFYINPDKVNDALKHPLLKRGSFRQLPMVLKAAILQDYFFRIAFPGFNFGVFAYANEQLRHIEPRNVPLSIKLPIVGFWISCWVGLIAMVAVWIVLFMYS